MDRKSSSKIKKASLYIRISFSAANRLHGCSNIRIKKIQNYNPRILRNTNLYTRTKRYYWIDSKIFSQPEFRNLITPIKEPIACIQIQTGSLVLILVYIFNCLMFQPLISDIFLTREFTKPNYNTKISIFINEVVTN